jgi:hypothetical protein
MIDLDFGPLGLELVRDILNVLIVTFRSYRYPTDSTKGVWYDPVHYTEALINTLAWYAHQGIGLEVDFPIGDSLRRIYESEAALYSLKPFYRDHLFHVIDVCMLGHYLIERNFRGISKNDANTSKITLRHWYVASIFHDIGYVTELLSNAIRLTKDLKSPDIFAFCESMENAIEESETKCLKKIVSDGYFDGAEASLRKLEHGIASALYLKHILETVPNGIEKYDSSVKAVLSHNLFPGHCVHQNTDPIAALLILCDELQEWGRPVIETSKFVRYIVATRNLGDYELVRNQPLKNLRIKEGKNRHLQFVLQYFPPDEGHFDPVRVWFGKIANLERVAFDSPHKWWEVCIKTPLSRKFRLLGLYEMDLIRKCCWYNEELLPLRRWIETARKRSWYRKERCEEVISFTLDLHKIGHHSISSESLIALNKYQMYRLQEIYAAVENEWSVSSF